jgi:hypothetical protein
MRCTYTAPDILAGLIDGGLVWMLVGLKWQWIDLIERNTVQEVCSNAPKKRVFLFVV